MSLSLTTLLRLQFIYCVLGLVFNAISFYLISIGEKSLTPNDPLSGSIVMSIYALILISGVKKMITFYRLLMVLAIILLGNGGVLSHFIRESQVLYYSISSNVSLFDNNTKYWYH